MADNIFGDIAQTAGDALGSTVDAIGSGITGLGNGISSFLDSATGTDPNKLASNFRAAGIPAGAEPNYNYAPVSAEFSSSPETRDWRVKIDCPIIYDQNIIFTPLAKTMGMIFPYLPQITMSHTANYQQMDIVHTNYPFYAYKNSQVDEITITGKFTVQNQEEARYWLGCMHFLRTVTKMYFGQGPNLGNPPPICILNGYGDFVFNKVSCVVKNFSVQLGEDVDYIATNLGVTAGTESGPNLSFVPTLSTITVTLLPVYSRDRIKSFNLDAFAKGQLVIGSDGQGFI